MLKQHLIPKCTYNVCILGLKLSNIYIVPQRDGLYFVFTFYHLKYIALISSLNFDLCSLTGHVYVNILRHHARKGRITISGRPQIHYTRGLTLTRHPSTTKVKDTRVY